MYELQIITERGETRKLYADRKKAKRAFHNRKARPATATEVCLHDLVRGETLNVWIARA